MITEPLISVIVPVYNVERYLDQCLESIVSQSYPHLEILVVDDGSTDVHWGCNTSSLSTIITNSPCMTSRAVLRAADKPPLG